MTPDINLFTYSIVIGILTGIELGICLGIILGSGTNITKLGYVVNTITNKYYMNIPERLDRVCEKLYGGNKAAMARAFGVLPQTLTKYYAGIEPSAKTLLRMAEAGINLHWFLTGEGEMMSVVENPSEEMEQLKEENQNLKRAIVAIRTVTDGVLVAGRVGK